jgi:hypothetical protein
MSPLQLACSRKLGSLLELLFIPQLLPFLNQVTENLQTVLPLINEPRPLLKEALRQYSCGFCILIARGFHVNGKCVKYNLISHWAVHWIILWEGLLPVIAPFPRHFIFF